MSAASVWVTPKPIAGPLTATMLGFERASRCSQLLSWAMPMVETRGRMPVSGSLGSGLALKSTPAQNTGPLAVITMAPTASESLPRSTAAMTSRVIRTFQALRVSGRL